MSMTQTTARRDPAESPRCPHCDAVLPEAAAFCGACGEPIEEQASASHAADDEDISARYRITSLVRRRPYISLYFATDSRTQRPVALTDIDMSSLDEQAQGKALQLVKREYNLLSRQQIPYVMPVIEQMYRRGHLSIVAGNPFVSTATGKADARSEQAKAGEQLRTLHDVLQSGIGLPGEEVAIRWLLDLCEAVDRLHGHQIVIGELDPEVIVMGSEDYTGHPALMLSWLPLYIRTLLPMTPGANSQALTRTPKAGPFCAPELQEGKMEARSDVYSLGALLYLLLTGVPPTITEQRAQQRMRTPREINSRIRPEIDEIVMRALAPDRSERFQSAATLAESLAHPHMSTQVVRYSRPRPATSEKETPKAPITPKGKGKGKKTAHLETNENRETKPREKAAPPTEGEPTLVVRRPTSPTAEPSEPERPIEDIPTVIVTQDAPPSPGPAESQAAPPQQAEPTKQAPTRALIPRPRQPEESEEKISPAKLAQQLQKRITGLLPAIQGVVPLKERTATPSAPAEKSFLRQVQRFILGEQQHSTTAAAIIETPLRLQPEQHFAIRVRLMGRDKALPPPGARKGAKPAGLSAIAHGDRVNIEVRSALYQRYAFVIQRAVITMPAKGYAADVTIPMPPPGQGRGGRRERLHIFFTDEQRRPLYEKPFAIEIFVSPLVRPGQEGHQSLPIPF